MQAVVSASALSAAIGAAGLASDPRSPVAALAHAHLSASEGDLKVICNNLDFAVTITVPATIEQPGQCAPSAAALHGLAKNFAADLSILLALDATTLRVSGGRSRFNLPALALSALPAPLQIGTETGQVEVDAAALRMAIKHTEFAIADDPGRYYLNGLHLVSADERLIASASDGKMAARASVAVQGALVNDVIFPAAAVKAAEKLLRGCSASVQLRVSKSLAELTVGDAVLTSKLIDGKFPDFGAVIPHAPSHRASFAREPLEQALARLAAIVPRKQELPATVDLEWGEDLLRLRMLPETALEELEAHDVAGGGKVAIKLDYLVAALEHTAGDRVRLAGNGPHQPLLVTASDDTLFLIAAVSRPRA